MPAALAIGGFVGGFSGTLINGGSIGQAFGMGIVGAFAGGVGGVAFQGLSGIARVAALTAIGATAGASGSAIMGGNIGLGAAAGAAAGFIGGAVGGRLADSWKAGLWRTTAGIATAAAGGAASAAVAGGNAGQGALMGFTGAATYALASASFQAAVDAGRRQAGVAADRQLAASTLRRGQGGEGVFVRRWDAEGPLTVTKGSWEVQGYWPPEEMLSHMPMGGGGVLVTLGREITYTQSGHWSLLGGNFQGETYTRSWSTSEFKNVPGTLMPSYDGVEGNVIYREPSD